LKFLSSTQELIHKLNENTRQFREGMEKAGFRIVKGTHPITPVLFGHLKDDAKIAQEFAAELLEEGIYVIGFSYPVVPKGKARIRVQISAAHSKENIDFALKKFTKVGKKLGAI